MSDYVLLVIYVIGIFILLTGIVSLMIDTDDPAFPLCMILFGVILSYYSFITVADKSNNEYIEIPDNYNISNMEKVSTYVDNDTVVVIYKKKEDENKE